MPNFPRPGTPVGGAGIGAAVATIIMYPISLWPPFERTPSAFQAAVQTVVTFFVAYLGGWLSLVATPGQKVNLELTSSPLPTVQSVPTGNSGP